MLKKLVVSMLLAISMVTLVACSKSTDNLPDKRGAAAVVNQNEETELLFEFSIVEDGNKCTKAEADKFFEAVLPELESKVERIWMNGWQNGSGVQGCTVDDDVIYNSLMMLEKEAYISNSYESIIENFNSGKKVVLIGKDLVTDESTYTIGDEEYEIIGIFKEGPMQEHMVVPFEAYPNLDNIDVFLIQFTESLSEAERELLYEAAQDAFGGKIEIEAIKEPR